MDFRVQDHVDALRDPAIWPVAPREQGDPIVVQTHVSVVVLCGDRAFKFKKAVRLAFLDQSTPAHREAACGEELRINRRLCPDVYLGVAALRRTALGLRFDAASPAGGDVVDHAVVMRRLPADRMLDALLERDAVATTAIEALARHVAAFHRQQARAADDAVRAAGAPEHLIALARDNFRETAALCGVLFDPELHALLATKLECALPALSAALAGRAREGRVVDGHGDLHARNVCMVEPPAIYDALEFSAAFRCGDVATEVAFLAMDLRYRGHRALAERFVEAYANAAGDDGLRAVLPELVRYRAMVRAKVDALAARDESIDVADRERAAAAARRHLRLAAWTCAEDGGAFALIASGLPGSGKSFVFDALSREAGWPCLSTDRVRKELCGAAPHERLPAAAYDAATNRRVYDELVARARACAGPVLLDGNFPRRDRRRDARDALGRRTLLVGFTIDMALAHDRLRARVARDDAVSDADAAVHDALRSEYESIETSREAPAILVDCAADATRSLDRIACALLRG